MVPVALLYAIFRVAQDVATMFEFCAMSNHSLLQCLVGKPALTVSTLSRTLFGQIRIEDSQASVCLFFTPSFAAIAHAMVRGVSNLVLPPLCFHLIFNHPRYLSSLSQPQLSSSPHPLSQHLSFSFPAPLQQNHTLSAPSSSSALSVRCPLRSSDWPPQ